jgi:hypothetical protein
MLAETREWFELNQDSNNLHYPQKILSFYVPTKEEVRKIIELIEVDDAFKQRRSEKLLAIKLISNTGIYDISNRLTYADIKRNGNEATLMDNGRKIKISNGLYEEIMSLREYHTDDMRVITLGLQSTIYKMVALAGEMLGFNKKLTPFSFASSYQPEQFNSLNGLTREELIALIRRCPQDVLNTIMEIYQDQKWR